METQVGLSRILRCLLLDADAYEELRTNASETATAVLLLFATSYAAGLGGFIWTFVAASDVDHVRFFVRSFLFGSAIQVLVFLLWVAIAATVLERAFLVPVRYTELFRAMAFAFTPVALQLIIFIPALDQPIGIVALGAALYLCTYAIQATTVATAGQAFCASILGFAVFCCILGILGNGTVDLAPGLFALDPNSLSVGLTFPVALPR